MTERNRELFFEVADAIEAEPERYEQSTYYHFASCGTTGCIAGWAVAIGRCGGDLTQAEIEYGENYTSYQAVQLLGLTPPDASLLFRGSWEPHYGLSVPDALRKVGEGAVIADVTHPDVVAQDPNF